MKKVWEKPVLIVLTRSKPEEMVLNGCKGGSVWNSSSTIYEFCTQPPGTANVPCGGCNIVTSS